MKKNLLFILLIFFLRCDTIKKYLGGDGPVDESGNPQEAQPPKTNNTTNTTARDIHMLPDCEYERESAEKDKIRYYNHCVNSHKSDMTEEQAAQYCLYGASDIQEIIETELQNRAKVGICHHAKIKGPETVEEAIILFCNGKLTQWQKAWSIREASCPPSEELLQAVKQWQQR